MARYIPMCELEHELDLPGATADGLWFGAVQDSFDAARAEADGHAHGRAFVAMLVGDALVGAVTRQQ